jgi:hypothetical protein
MKREIRSHHKARVLPIHRGGTGTNNTSDISKSLNVIAKNNPDIIELDENGHIKDISLITALMGASADVKAGMHLKRTRQGTPVTGISAQAGEVCDFEITDFDSAYTYTVTPLKGETVTAVSDVTKKFTYTAPATPAASTDYGFTLGITLKSDAAKKETRKVILTINASAT